MIIVIDTREQLPLDFRRSKLVEDVKYQTLKTGDYSILGYEDKIAIERKSANDIYGTLGKGHKRFKKELERALELDYFAILIERPYTEILNKDFDGAEFIKQMRGDIVIKILYTLKFKYGIDIIFCNGRKEAASIIRNMFAAYVKHNNNTEKERRLGSS